MMMRSSSSSPFVSHHRNHTAKIINHNDHCQVRTRWMDVCGMICRAFSEFCLQLFFPHWLPGNQSHNWKLFYRFGGASVEGFKRNLFTPVLRRVALKYRGRDDSFPWITMSNKPARRRLVNSIIKDSRGTCRNLMYSMVFRKIADLFILASSPATMFFNSMILKAKDI